MLPGAGREVNTTIPLILNLVATVFCCTSGLGPILGIVGIVFAIQAGSARKTGDLETAQRKAKSSLILAVVALVLGAIGSGGVGFYYMR